MDAPREDIPQSPEIQRCVLRLYVAGQSARSLRAVENLKQVVEKYLPEAEYEVIDIYQQGELCKERNLIGAPTLERLTPLPVRRMLGDLSNEEKVVEGLGLERIYPEA